MIVPRNLKFYTLGRSCKTALRGSVAPGAEIASSGIHFNSLLSG
jgi:hypothetical protein